MAADEPKGRPNSFSQASEASQTAQEFINSQLQLEADAREALPYQFDTCTRTLGPLRQLLFACITCNPPPKQPAAVCYSCSISCHGEHDLVELFNKRNFACDCGTTRYGPNQHCSLRVNAETGEKGGVHSEIPAETNKYNQNFGNKFCGCAEDYNAHSEKGTMFQCTGLGSVEDGGCGEDWYHPECIMGLPRNWRENMKAATPKKPINGTPTAEEAPVVGAETTIDPTTEKPSEPTNPPVAQDVDMTAEAEDTFDEQEDDAPPGFPKEDDFEYFLCYKCVDAFPWIKRHASTTGFLAPVFHSSSENPATTQDTQTANVSAKVSDTNGGAQRNAPSEPDSKKRKASPDAEESSGQPSKRQRSSDDLPLAVQPDSACSYETLPPAPTGSFSLFLKEDFRTALCRCPTHFPLLSPHPQLLDDEDTYEPPLSVSEEQPGSLGSRSLLDRGEAALSNMDRVKAIEGVMVYNHLKDKVKNFLKPFAESGKPVGADDIKKYFEALRGDAEGIKEAGKKAEGEGGGSGEGDNRKEQSGY